MSRGGYTLLGGSGGGAPDTTTIPQPDGKTGAAGVGTSASPADHVHPRTQWAAADHSLITWTGDPQYLRDTQLVTPAGTLFLGRLHVPVATTITNIVMYVSAIGVTLTSGQNFAGLWSAAGTLLSTTADLSTGWQSTGLKTTALTTPQAVTAGDVYAGFWTNGSTLPSFIRGSNLGANLVNAGLSAPNLRFCSANTALTTTAPSTLGTQTATNLPFWMALS